jgi:hypothetical protein
MFHILCYKALLVWEVHSIIYSPLKYYTEWFHYP